MIKPWDEAQVGFCGLRVKLFPFRGPPFRGPPFEGPFSRTNSQGSTAVALDQAAFGALGGGS